MQNLRVSAVSHPHGELPPVPALAAAEGGVSDSATGAAGASGRRPATLREVAEPRDGGEYRAAYPAVARIARDDAEPAPGALARFPVLSVADRKRPDDAQPRNAGEDFRSAWCWLEPLLRSGIKRRSSAGGSIHPGVAAVPAAVGLGTVAIDSEASGRDQRPRLQRQRTGASFGAASVGANGAVDATDSSSRNGPQVKIKRKSARDGANFPGRESSHPHERVFSPRDSLASRP